MSMTDDRPSRHLLLVQQAGQALTAIAVLFAVLFILMMTGVPVGSGISAKAHAPASAASPSRQGDLSLPVETTGAAAAMAHERRDGRIELAQATFARQDSYTRHIIATLPSVGDGDCGWNCRSRAGGVATRTVRERRWYRAPPTVAPTAGARRGEAGPN